MTHDEIIKECDRISKNKFESRNCIFQYLKQQENAKLNHDTVYEDSENQYWFIKIASDNSFITYPFGFFFCDYFNQLNVLNNKESFNSYWNRVFTGAKKQKSISPTFDRDCIFRFFFEPNDTLESVYENYHWLSDVLGKEFAPILNAAEYISSDNFVDPSILIDYYKYFQKFVFKVWLTILRKGNYTSTDGDSEFTEKDIDEISSNNLEERFVSMFRYVGSTYLEITNGTVPSVIVKKYDVANFLWLVCEDFLRFMTHQTSHSFKICPECGCMFVTTHGNQKNCPSCKEIIRQKKRKENIPRYTHKKITDFLNNNGDDDDSSKMFRIESNYYWAIVQGEKPKTSKENWYRDDIKTEIDYQKWLDNESIRLKKLITQSKKINS